MLSSGGWPHGAQCGRARAPAGTVAWDEVGELSTRSHGRAWQTWGLLESLRSLKTSSVPSSRGSDPLVLKRAQASEVPWGFLCAARVANQWGLSFACHAGECVFSPEWDGKPLKGIKQRSDGIWVIYLKDFSGCCMEDGLWWIRTGSRLLIVFLWTYAFISPG